MKNLNVFILCVCLAFTSYNAVAKPVTTSIAVTDNIPTQLFTISIPGIKYTRPAKLISFHVILNTRKKVEIKWVVTEEATVDRYEIQRSADGINWKTICIAFSANSASLQTYTFKDEALLNPTGYYRIKEVDNDASFTYSKIRKVRVNNKNSQAGAVASNPNR